MLSARSLPALLLLLALPASASSAEPCSAEGGWVCPAIPVTLEPLMAGASKVAVNVPTALIFSAIEPGGPEHVVVADKDGVVMAYDRVSGVARTWLSLDGIASVNPERGLLGLALAPGFADGDARFVTYHTVPRSDAANAQCRRLPPGKGKKLEALCAKGEELGCGGAFIVTEWTIDPRADDPSATASSRELLRRPQPGEGHNAGHVLFGPDGMLYVSVGDGGAQNDPCSRGQDVSQPYSAILRLDPTTGEAPADNPFVGSVDAEPLIWAYGFRNPWRLEFTPEGLDGVPAGVLLAGDTGQSRREEIDVVMRGGNYGWSVREGTLNHPHPGVVGPHADFVAPLFEYGSGEGKAGPAGGFAVVGGVVATAPGPLQGMYLMGDNATQVLQALDLRAAALGDPSTWDGRGKAHVLRGAKLPAATFGRDAAGEVYVGGSGGGVFRVVAQ